MQQFSDSHILATAQTNKTKALEMAFDVYWELLTASKNHLDDLYERLYEVLYKPLSDAKHNAAK